MATISERLLNAAIRHRIGLERVSAATVRKVLALIKRVEQDVLRRIAVRASLGRGDNQLQVLLAELRSLYDAGYQHVHGAARADIDALAQYEAAFQAHSLGAILGYQLAVPTYPVLIAAVNARPFQGKLLQGWLDGLVDGAAGRVMDAIRMGFVEGQSTDAMIRVIRGTRAAAYKDGLMAISRRGAEAMIRTAITHTASVAQESVYEANAGVIVGIEWISTLDNRTTPICQERDGKVYAVGKGPRPPAHINCRSTTMARLKGSEPPPRLTYAEWLAKQTPARQDDILGKTRGRLYREGKLPIDRFVDPAGRMWTLEELRRREGGAFEEAGL
jgi:SPP1 gp7 family putative phage head morphogenesis protein